MDATACLNYKGSAAIAQKYEFCNNPPRRTIANMENSPSSCDVLIVGAGPAGICCAIELQARGMDVLLIEKGSIVHSLDNFPARMRFFTSPKGLEMGGLSMHSSEDRPSRSDVVNYYRRIAAHFQLKIHQNEKVLTVEGTDGDFLARTSAAEYSSRKVIIATGYYDRPNYLGIPGEDLAKVAHYYKEPDAYSMSDVAVIGGRNSAGGAALELCAAGARVLLIYRRSCFTSGMKPWLRSDLETHIGAGKIRALFSSHVTEIGERTITVETPDGTLSLPNDFVFAMTGYHPDVSFLNACGVEINPDTRRPCISTNTLQTSRNGIYLAGVAVSGLITNELNISHAPDHARRITESIADAMTNSSLSRRNALEPVG
jgi:thioredoxin reductase (NADPH)